MLRRTMENNHWFSTENDLYLCMVCVFGGLFGFSIDLLEAVTDALGVPAAADAPARTGMDTCDVR